MGPVSNYIFNNITANHTIAATFTPVTYTITATAGSGGSINPSGTLTVNHGTSLTYTITANSGYQIGDVRVDNISVGAVSGYTLTNITANHTITVGFVPLTLSNIALNKPTTSQSNESGNVSSRANDNDGTNSSYWAASPYPRWWKVDLGAIYDLSSIVIRNYVDNNRYYRYNIEVSVDDNTYSVIASKTNNNIATNAGDTYTVSATGRYIRVNMTYNSANVGVHITDFRAYGSTSGSKGTINDQQLIKQNIIIDSMQLKTTLKEINVNIFPNPFNEEFTIRIDSQFEDIYELSIYNLTGTLIYSGIKIPSNMEIKFNKPLVQGIYILILKNKEKRIIYRIVKY